MTVRTLFPVISIVTPNQMSTSNHFVFKHLTNSVFSEKHKHHLDFKQHGRGSCTLWDPSPNGVTGWIMMLSNFQRSLFPSTWLTQGKWRQRWRSQWQLDTNTSSVSALCVLLFADWQVPKIRLILFQTSNHWRTPKQAHWRVSLCFCLHDYICGFAFFNSVWGSEVGVANLKSGWRI